MKTLVVVAALVAVFLIGCDSNATGPATSPVVSQSATKTLPINTVIERLDGSGQVQRIEVLGSAEYSVVELMPDEGEAVAHSYYISVTFSANLKDLGTQDTWRAVGSSTDRFTFAQSCKQAFTKDYAIQRMPAGSNLNVEFEIANNNLAASQIWIT